MKQIFLSTLIVLSCTANKNEFTSASSKDSVIIPDVQQEISNPADELHDSDYGIHHLTLNIHKSLPPYTLVFHLPNQRFYLYNKKVEGNDAIQEFPFSEDLNYEEGHFANPESGFNLIDYNFDGYKDLSIVRISANANGWYDIYLFDPSSEKFKKDELLSEVSSPQADSINRFVRFHNSGGYGGAWYNAGIIEWQKNKPVVIREEEQNSSEENTDIFVRTIRIRQPNGEMVLASKVKLQQGENKKEKLCLLEGDWTEFDKYHQLLFAESKADIIKVDGRNGSCN